MEANNLKATVYARLDAIAAAEKITRVELGALSREALMYVPDSDDIDLVNRLLGVLTPMNRETAIQFFKHFLPWDVEETADGDFSRFGKRTKKTKRLEKKLAEITEFLSDEENNIWTWAGENIEITVTQVKGAEFLGKAIDESLKGKKTKTKVMEPMSKVEIVEVLIDKISLDELLHAVATAQAKVLAAAKAEEAANMPVQGPVAPEQAQAA